MDDRETLTRLRSLVYRGDGPGLVAALAQQPWPADSLQLIGDGLVAAVRAGIGGGRVGSHARQCARGAGMTR